MVSQAASGTVALLCGSWATAIEHASATAAMQRCFEMVDEPSGHADMQRCLHVIKRLSQAWRGGGLHLCRSWRTLV